MREASRSWESAGAFRISIELLLASFTGCSSDASGKVRADDGSISTESPNAPVTPTCSVIPGLEGVGGIFLVLMPIPWYISDRGWHHFSGQRKPFVDTAGRWAVALACRIVDVISRVCFGRLADGWRPPPHRLLCAGSFCILFSPSYMVDYLAHKPHNLSLSQSHEIDYYTANNRTQLISINNNYIYQPVNLSLFQKCPYNIWERH